MRDTKSRVSVVYPFLPHYRRGIFRELDDSMSFEYEFLSDTVGRAGIVPLDTSEVKRHKSVQNRWIGRALWQHGLLRIALTSDSPVWIFLGDASYLSTWVAAALLRLRRKKVLFWTIGWHRPERGIRRLIRMGFYRLANGLLLYGQNAIRIGEESGYPASRMWVIYNSNPPKYLSEGEGRSAPLFRSEIFDSEHPIVGAVIRLTPTKHLDLLVRAGAYASELGHPLTIALVGDGPVEHELVALAKRLSVDLRIHPAVYEGRDLERVYERLRVTVVPNAVGLTAVQSMYFGTPVISGDDANQQMPEWEAIIPGVTGAHFRHGDARSLAEAILTWTRKDLDVVGRACVTEVSTRWNPVTQREHIEAAVREA
jgi:glycosyltransferase involved in cell wall biosynthesis